MIQRVSDNDARIIVEAHENSQCSGCSRCNPWRDLLDARKRIEYTQPLVDAIFWIIDSLDDPYEGDGDSWQACTQEQCAGELDRIRAALVPATGEFLAARAAEGGGDE